MMHLSDFGGVVSQEVMNDELIVLAPGEESQYSPIVIQKLFLRGHSSSPKGFLHKLFQIIRLSGGLGLCCLVQESVRGDSRRLRLGLTSILKFEISLRYDNVLRTTHECRCQCQLF